MDFPPDISLRLIAAFTLGLMSGLLLAIYFNMYRLWGVVLRFFHRKRKTPPVPYEEEPDYGLINKMKDGTPRDN